MALFTKPIRNILIGSALLAALSAAPYFFPDHIALEHSVFLNARPERVFQHLNNPSEWEKWSVWSSNYDPSHSSFFQGPVSGVNSEISWKGEKEEGRAVITFSEPGKIVKFSFFPNPQQELESAFLLEKVENGTRITWTTQGNLPGYTDKLKGIWLKKKLNRDLTAGLNGLQKLVAPAEKKLAFRKPPGI
jgi:uncharacterized protein YndB with AHSA1/START domain